jgi:hypothetical protein
LLSGADPEEDPLAWVEENIAGGDTLPVIFSPFFSSSLLVNFTSFILILYIFVRTL